MIRPVKKPVLLTLVKMLFLSVRRRFIVTPSDAFDLGCYAESWRRHWRFFLVAEQEHHDGACPLCLERECTWTHFGVCKYDPGPNAPRPPQWGKRTGPKKKLYFLLGNPKTLFDEFYESIGK